LLPAFLPAFDSGFPELVDPSDGSTTVGNQTQLWPVGAYLDFDRIGAHRLGRRALRN
jgi:hypothetical protein